jgi:hypothetical protein
MTAAVVTALGSCAMFIGPVMTGVAYVALAIPGLVRVEVVERLISAFGHRSDVTMARIIPIVDVAIEAVRTVIPRTRSYEHAAVEPIWPIVPVGRTTIGRIVVVPIRTNRRGSNANGNLGRCCCCTSQGISSRSTTPRSKRADATGSAQAFRVCVKTGREPQVPFDFAQGRLSMSHSSLPMMVQPTHDRACNDSRRLAVREMTNLREHDPFVGRGKMPLQAFGFAGRIAKVRPALNHQGRYADVL